MMRYGRAETYIYPEPLGEERRFLREELRSLLIVRDSSMSSVSVHAFCSGERGSSSARLFCRLWITSLMLGSAWRRVTPAWRAVAFAIAKISCSVAKHAAGLKPRSLSVDSVSVVPWVWTRSSLFVLLAWSAMIRSGKLDLS